jgi:uncharacterized protein
MPKIILKKPFSFEWDIANEQKNWIKHKVLAKEAEDVFYDNKKLLLEDIKHSENEQRFVLIGKTKEKRMLFIIFTMREKRIRIISVRDTSRKEEMFYEKTINTAKIQK